MADDRTEEDMVETEDKLKPGQSIEGQKSQETAVRESAPPRATSPFQSLAEPKSAEDLVDREDMPSKPVVPKQTSYTPAASENPVVAAPIQQVVDRERERISKPPSDKKKKAFEELESSFADEWRAVLSNDESIMDLGADMMVKDDEPFPFQKEVLTKQTVEENDTVRVVSDAAAGLIEEEKSPAPTDAGITDEEEEDDLNLDDVDEEQPFELTAEDDLADHIEDGSPAEPKSPPSQAMPAANGPPPVKTEPKPGEAGAAEIERGDSPAESIDISVDADDEDDEVFELGPEEEIRPSDSPAEVEKEDIPVVADGGTEAPPANGEEDDAEDLTDEITEEDASEEKRESAAAEQEPEETSSKEDDAEEIDLADAEEMSAAPPAVPSGQGRKPRIRRRKKRSTEWWARIFNDDYVSTIPKATVRGDQRKVNFIEKSLALPLNSLVLDLGCGNGRHSVGMAKRGYRVVGIDLSLPMLAQAAELAQDENQNINFIHGDMRDLSFDRTFDGIFCMGTTFGYFDDDTNFTVLQGVARSLKPGGAFLLEVANRDHVITQAPDLTWFEGNGSVCMEETAFDFNASRIEVNRQLIMDGGRQVQNKVSIRLYCLHEIREMLTRAGLAVTSVSGHGATQGAFFGKDSVRILVSAVRSQ